MKQRISQHLTAFRQALNYPGQGLNLGGLFAAFVVNALTPRCDWVWFWSWVYCTTVQLVGLAILCRVLLRKVKATREFTAASRQWNVEVKRLLGEYQDAYLASEGERAAEIHRKIDEAFQRWNRQTRDFKHLG